jgi:hypothetical protein
VCYFILKTLIQFHVHAEMANVTAHVVTNTHVVQLPMSTQRRHSACWVVTFLLPSTAHSFMYCHRLEVYGTSLETFWYTLVHVVNINGSEILTVISIVSAVRIFGLPGYYSLSCNVCCPTFWDCVVASPSRVRCLKNNVHWTTDANNQLM